MEAIHEAVQYTKGTHPRLRVYVESVNRSETHFINTVKEGVRYCKAVGIRNMIVYPDRSHIIHEETSCKETAEVCGKVYLGYTCVCENNRSIPGMELAPWEEFFTVLYDIGYEGPRVIESFDPSSEELGASCVIRRKFADTREELAVRGLANLKCIAVGLGA